MQSTIFPMHLALIDDSAPTHQSKLVTTYNYMLPKKRTMVAEECEEKNCLRSKNITPQKKEEP